VLYHRVSRATVVVNQTGSLIWEQLAAPCGAADLVAALRARFPCLPPTDAERDVAVFLDGLAAHALITPA
jgi:hypothetical protein